MPVPSGFTLIFDSGSSTRFAVTRILRAMATPDFRVNVVREHYAGARGAAIGKAAPLRRGHARECDRGSEPREDELGRPRRARVGRRVPDGDGWPQRDGALARRPARGDPAAARLVVGVEPLDDPLDDGRD